jgi:hypothetical protein
VFETEIVEGTGDLHDSIADVVSAKPNIVLEDAAALDSADDVLDTHTAT